MRVKRNNNAKLDRFTVTAKTFGSVGGMDRIRFCTQL